MNVMRTDHFEAEKQEETLNLNEPVWLERSEHKKEHLKDKIGLDN